MTDAIRKFVRWLLLGAPEPVPKVDLEKHDQILTRMERLRDPVTRRVAGPRRPQKRIET